MPPHRYTSPEGVLNLWRGFGVAAKQGSWDKLRDHLLKVICRGNPRHFLYVYDWAAFMVQHPEAMAEVALVFRGGKGCGKGIFFRALVHLLGQHGMQIANPQQLVGRFNDHLGDLVALFADEAFYAGDKQHEGVLKGLVTEPSLPIEAKFHSVVNRPNRLHIMMASNSDWVFPATGAERRFFMLDASDEKIGDKAYFEAIQDELEHGGYVAMLYDLQHAALFGFHPRNMPSTEALNEQKRRSMRPEEKRWADVLSRGGLGVSNDGLVPTKGNLENPLDTMDWTGIPRRPIPCSTRPISTMPGSIGKTGP